MAFDSNDFNNEIINSFKKLTGWTDAEILYLMELSIWSGDEFDYSLGDMFEYGVSDFDFEIVKLDFLREIDSILQNEIFRWLEMLENISDEKLEANLQYLLKISAEGFDKNGFIEFAENYLENTHNVDAIIVGWIEKFMERKQLCINYANFIYSKFKERDKVEIC